MRVIIAGSREVKIENNKLWELIKDSGFDITEIVSGGCRGADQAGELYADIHDIPVKKFPADWNKHGKSAGPRRNQEMADYADVLILLWNGESRGSFDMLTKAFYGKLKIHIVMVRR